ncbi:HlyD family secretion protein [Campylobacter sp. MIT 99-7217]|uniref:HlyD family secretion protein n=1 Tax=Campylobacter sp. MIT 99-7217 TaxID=535091 RepID=UPI00163BD801|nr:efflux RND transporter periplasmic adaptor subunit [Campylobacter sp. MIT 99-7217]
MQAQKSDIQTQIAPLKERLSTAKRELERAQRLFSSGASTKKALDDANSNFNLVSKEIDSKLSSMNLSNESLDNEIANSQIQAQIIEDKIQKATIISPISGTVLEKYAFKGELSSPNKALFKIANLDTLRLKAYVIDTDLTRLKLGDEVAVYVDFGEDYKEYKGRISWISSKAEFTPKTIMVKDERKNLVYGVKIDVKNDGFLKIGSYGEIKLK